MADEATFAARMSAAKSMSPAAAPKATPPPAPAPAAKTAPADDALPEGDDGTEPASGAVEPAETPEAETPAGDAGTPEERLAAAQAAWDKGDFDGAAKALGKKAPEPVKQGFIKLNKARDKHQRRIKADDDKLEAKRIEIRKAEQNIANENARVTSLLRHGDQKYGWVARTEQAWDNDDKVAFAKGIEKMAKGASLAHITQWLAGARDKPAEDKSVTEERAKLTREKEEWERAKAHAAAEREKEQKALSTIEQRQALVTKFGAKFKEHPFLANPDKPGEPDEDALEEAFEAYTKTWKNGRFEKTASQVLDELHAKELRRIKRMGLVPAAKETPAPAAGKKPASVARLPEPPPSQKPPAGRAPLEDRIAMAKRLGEQQRRGIR
jgi:hypothetical protein